MDSRTRNSIISGFIISLLIEYGVDNHFHYFGQDICDQTFNYVDKPFEDRNCKDIVKRKRETGKIIPFSWVVGYLYCS